MFLRTPLARPIATSWRPYMRTRLSQTVNLRPVRGLSTLQKPTSISGKLLYRSDGTPRSKWVGLAFGGLVAYHVWALFELEQELVESEIGKSLLVAFMMAQQVDNSKYHKLDRSNLEDTLVFLQALFDAFSPPFTDMQGEERLPLLVRSVHPTPDKKEELLKITVAAAEEIHSRMKFDTTEKLDEAVPLVVQILLRTYADIIDVLGLEASDLIQDAEAYESIT